MKFVFPLLFAVMAFTAGAAESGMPPGPHEMPAAMKAAFDICKKSGRPGDSKFEACMASKGFKRPDGPRPPADENGPSAGVSPE